MAMKNNSEKMFIEIIGKDFKLPFSAVVLANSLETIGIDFYKIAQKIRAKLESDRRKQLYGNELKELVFRFLYQFAFKQ